MSTNTLTLKFPGGAAHDNQATNNYITGSSPETSDASMPLRLRLSYGIDMNPVAYLLAVRVRTDGTKEYLVRGVEQTTMAAMAFSSSTRHPNTDEQDKQLHRLRERLYAAGLLLSVSKPSTVNIEEENARLRALPPHFSYKKSIATILREARSHLR